MNIFLPVLFISLLAVTIFIFFAFFPIRVSWFYCTDSPDDFKPQKQKNKKPDQSVKIYDFSDEYKNYRHKEEDNYDDTEL